MKKIFRYLVLILILAGLTSLWYYYRLITKEQMEQGRLLQQSIIESRILRDNSKKGSITPPAQPDSCALFSIGTFPAFNFIAGNYRKYTAIITPGINISQISPRIMFELGLELDKTRDKHIIIDSIRISNTNIHSIPVILDGELADIGADLSIGPDFAEGALIMINLKRSSLTFLNGRLPAPDGQRILHLVKKKSCGVFIKIGEKSYFASINPEIEGHLTIPPYMAQRIPAKYDKDFGNGELKDMLEIGEFRIDKCPVQVRPTDNHTICMGRELLQQFIITIDNSNSYIRFGRH